MVAVTLSQNLLQIVSMMMVVHLGERALSSCALAFSLSTVAGFSVLVFNRIGEFFSFAPVCDNDLVTCHYSLSWSLEWWSYELLVLLSGLLPNPELETSVISVCLMTISTLYGIPYGLGAAASTRVSNELRAGDSRAARMALYGAVLIAVSTLFPCRHVFGYVFSNEKEVVDYVTTMSPLVCFPVIVDCIQGVLSGVARGCGWQQTGTYINLRGAFYICGIPVATMLGFGLRLRVTGLWVGTLTGAFAQTILLSIDASCTNWERQAIKARERVLEEGSLVKNGLIWALKYTIILPPSTIK